MLKFPWDVCLLDCPLGCSQDYGRSVYLVSELLKWMNMTKSERQGQSQTTKSLCKNLHCMVTIEIEIYFLSHLHVDDFVFFPTVLYSLV